MNFFNSVIFQRVILPIILIVVAVFFCILGVKDIKAHQTFEKTTAIITKIEVIENTANDNTYNVYVKYEADNKTYESQLGEYVANYKEGKNVEILYNPQNPEEIAPASFTGIVVRFILALLMFVMGLFFGAKTIFLFVMKKRTINN